MITNCSASICSPRPTIAFKYFRLPKPNERLMAGRRREQPVNRSTTTQRRVEMDTPEDLVHRSAEALRTEVGHLRKELSAMAAKIKDMAAEKGQETYSKARASAAVAREKAELASESASRAIEERPLVSVIVAFFIGVVVGATLLAAVPTREEDR
jgi:ElaB/YqjD/DUF883 family membrane-anchored ribosome-binding protein